MIWHKILKHDAHPESDTKGCRKNRVKARRALVVVALAWLLTVAPSPSPVPAVIGANRTSAASAEAQVASWSRTYGGTSDDEARAIVPTSDGRTGATSWRGLLNPLGLAAGMSGF